MKIATKKVKKTGFFAKKIIFFFLVFFGLGANGALYKWKFALLRLLFQGLLRSKQANALGTNGKLPLVLGINLKPANYT